MSEKEDDNLIDESSIRVLKKPIKFTGKRVVIINQVAKLKGKEWKDTIMFSGVSYEPVGKEVAG